MKHPKKWLAAFVAATLFLSAVPCTALAAEPSVRTVEVPREYGDLGLFLVGPGADMTDNTIVMNLKENGSVSASYTLMTLPFSLSYPDYMAEITYDDSGEDIHVSLRYDPKARQYIADITAHQVTDASLSLSLFQREGSSRYIQCCRRYLTLKVIDGEESANDSDDSQRIDALQSQASKINLEQGLLAAAPGEGLTLDIGDDNILSTSWYQILSRYPDKTLRVTGERYAWTVTGRDILSLGNAFRYDMAVSFSSPPSHITALQRAAGTSDLLPVNLPDFGNLQTKANLELRLSQYHGQLVDVYAYQNGKAVLAASQIPVSADGDISFPIQQINSCRSYFVTPHSR